MLQEASIEHQSLRAIFLGMTNKWTPLDLPGLVNWGHFVDGKFVQEGTRPMKFHPGPAPIVRGNRYLFMCPAFPQYVASPTPFVEPQQWRELPMCIRVLPDGREAFLFPVTVSPR